MPNDTRSSQEIERDIERDRSQLAETIGEIQSRFSLEGIVNQVARGVRDHGGDFGHAVSETVRRNPLGLALTGVGVALLAFGRSDARHDGDDRRFPRGSVYDPAAAGGRDHRDYEGDHGLATDRRPTSVAGADPLGAGGPGRSYPTWYEDETGSRLGEPSRRGHASAEASASSSTGHDVTEAAGALAERARQARERMGRGTEDMTEEARQRVIAARERAARGGRRIRSAVGHGWERSRSKAANLFDEQPIIAGALAIAAGAAIAAALPRTRYEDERLGSTSDDLIAEAERIFSEERAKVQGVAKAALDETREVASEKGGEADHAAARAIGDVKQETGDAARRIKEAAESEADRRNLGKPNA